MARALGMHSKLGLNEVKNLVLVESSFEAQDGRSARLEPFNSYFKPYQRAN